MRVHALWSRTWLGILSGFEWLLLFFGLGAIDLYIWLNTSSMVYESYEDWAFDQDLRGVGASPWEFAREEILVLTGREHKAIKAARVPVELAKPPEASPLLQPSVILPSGVIGRLQIPDLHLTAMVEEGADARTLRHAVGHIPKTALPGAKGNVGLAGHRDTLFRALRNIQLYEAIEIQTRTAIYRYRVESTRIVGPRDVGVLAPSASQSLTLVTCYPFYYVGSAPKRFVVRAGLVAVVPSGSPTLAH